MLGQMMQQPLLISSRIQNAERHHGDQPVASHLATGKVLKNRLREQFENHLLNKA